MYSDELQPERRMISPEDRPRGFFSRVGQRILRAIGHTTPAALSEPESNKIRVLDDQSIISDQNEELILQSPDISSYLPESLLELETRTIVSDSTLVTLTRDGTSLHIFNGNHASNSKEINPAGNVPQLFERLTKMYMGSGEGSFTAQQVGESALSYNGRGYTEATVVRSTAILSQVLPHEIMNYNGQVISFGRFALATSLQTSSEIEAAIDFEDIAAYEAQLDTSNKDKQNLSLCDHAIVQQADRTYYINLGSPEGILTARVIDAMTIMLGEKISSADISQVVWDKMTTDERGLFVENTDFTLSPDESSRINVQTLAVLRRLTHKMFLSHERYDDSFTLTTSGLSIEYYADAYNHLKSGTVPNLRPIFVPGERELLALDVQQKQVAMITARQFMTQTRHREKLDQPDAIMMLTSIMSPIGWWAVREVCRQSDSPYKRPQDAQRYMHKHLKRNLDSAYYDAFQNRIINGTRVVNRKRFAHVRQVSGRIPSSSDWSLGRSMDDVFLRSNETRH